MSNSLFCRTHVMFHDPELSDPDCVFEDGLGQVVDTDGGDNDQLNIFKILDAIRCRPEFISHQVADYIGDEQMDRIYNYDFCELEPDFLAFMHVYAAAACLICPSTTVIDFGCYAGVQAALFRDARKYIGVDGCDTPRYEAPNVESYQCSIQEWIRTHPEYDHDHSVLAICSYVPDEGARKMVREHYWSVLDCYPGEPPREQVIPSKEKP